MTVYFPLHQIDHFMIELKWLYRSWTEMIKYEPTEWRTDLILFIEFDKNVFENDQFFLNHLNCSFTNIRKSPMDKPLCTLIHYVSVVLPDPL